MKEALFSQVVEEQSVARKRPLYGQTIDLRNSGDTAGPRDEVVGYGAWVFTAVARSLQ